MILHIHLRHWRAYEQLDLDLTKPVTFLVAPNGVGKTSLVEAVRFGLLGSRGEKSRGRAVKAGETTAEVRLVLVLADDATVEVTRTLRRTGTETFTATIDGEHTTEDEYLNALTNAWGAGPAMLDAVVFGPSTLAKSTGFPIKDHLAAVFGIDPLHQAATDVQQRQKAIAAQISALRDDLSGTDDAIAEATALVDQLTQDATIADQAQRQGTATANELGRAANDARSWQAFRATADAHREQAAVLLARLVEAADDISRRTRVVPGGTEDAQSIIEQLHRDTASALEVSAGATGKAELDAVRAGRASDFLREENDVCPTCLRPLSAHEREQALAEHGDTATNASDEVVRLRVETDRLRSRLARIDELSRNLARLRPPVEPTHPDPGTDAISRAEEAAQEANTLAQVAGAARERAATAARHLASLRSAADDQLRLTTLAREEALLGLAHESLVELAGRYVRERVEPLAVEIAHRWKIMFGRDGLRLAADGQLTVERGNVDLELTDLSGGERATALLVTRLMLASSVTSASTLWLDEPLEHLDPRRRVGVAQALVRAAQVGTVKQVLITTYEETIARHLVATSPDLVAMTNARTADDQLV